MKLQEIAWRYRRGLLPTVLLTLPRNALAYPLYALASLLTIDYKGSDRRCYYVLAAFIAWFGAAFIAINTRHDLSASGFMLELVLIFPLLLFLSGFRSSLTQADALASIRGINLICFIYSLVSLVEYGFPFKLPYVDFTTDAYWGPYGWGGARIVTIFGFTGFLFELASSVSSRWRLFWLLIALSNFMAPSYIMGIVCGLAAISLIAIKKPIAVLLLCLLLIPSGMYALQRLELRNARLGESSDPHPKVLAYNLVFELFSQEKTTLLTGTGLGQFTSTPQIWVSKPLRKVSNQSIPSVPGLYPSPFHLNYIEPITTATYTHNPNRSSALEKPYTGFSTLLAETGMLALVMAMLFLRRCWEICSRNMMALPFFVFFIALNSVDLWIDNLWLGYCLLLISPFFAKYQTDKAL